MDEHRARAAVQPDFIPYAPVVFISAKMGQRVSQVLDTALGHHRGAEKQRQHVRVEQDVYGRRCQASTAVQAGEVAEVLPRHPG